MGRMPRRNQWPEKACHHLMNRGHNREAIFLDDGAHPVRGVPHLQRPVVAAAASST
jgi:hypothetical protein